MFVKFGLPVQIHQTRLYSDQFAKDLSDWAPARLVPVMRTPEGDVIGDTIAMGETLHDRHPEAGLWPSDPSARAQARWMVAEMHSGFSALRGDCPMNLFHLWDKFEPSPAVLADVARMEEMWTLARSRFGTGGPWLFGRYSLADVFFAPAATRFATYQLPMGETAAAYVKMHLSDPAFLEWRATGLASDTELSQYDMGLPHAPWPGSAAG